MILVLGRNELPETHSPPEHGGVYIDREEFEMAVARQESKVTRRAKDWALGCNVECRYVNLLNR